MSVGSINLIQEYFCTTNPTVLMITNEQNEYPKFDLYDQQIIPPLILFDEKTIAVDPSEVSKFVHIEAVHFVETYGIDDQGEFFRHSTSNKIPLLPCKDIPTNSAIYEVWRNDKTLSTFVSNFGLCINPPRERLYVSGKPIDQVYATIVISIYPCTLQSGCETEDRVRTMTINIPEMKKSIDSSNKNHPLSTIPTLENLFNLNPMLTARIENKLRFNKIEDTAGFLSSNVVRASFIDSDNVMMKYSYRQASQTTCTTQEITSDTCIPYVRLGYSSSGSNRLVQRSYVGLFETLGNIGGLKEILLLIIALSYGCYYDRALRNHIAEEVYSLREVGDVVNKRKDSKKKKVLTRLASDEVEANLDVISLLKQLNHLKFVVDLLIDNRHLSILQFLVLSDAKSGLDRREAAKKNKAANTRGKTGRVTVEGDHHHQQPEDYLQHSNQMKLSQCIHELVSNNREDMLRSRNMLLGNNEEKLDCNQPPDLEKQSFKDPSSSLQFERANHHIGQKMSQAKMYWSIEPANGQGDSAKPAEQQSGNGSSASSQLQLFDAAENVLLKPAHHLVQNPMIPQLQHQVLPPKPYKPRKPSLKRNVIS